MKEAFVEAFFALEVSPVRDPDFIGVWGIAGAGLLPLDDAGWARAIAKNSLRFFRTFRGSKFRESLLREFNVLNLAGIKDGVAFQKAAAFSLFVSVFVICSCLFVVGSTFENTESFLSLANMAAEFLGLQEGEKVGGSKSGHSQKENVNALIVTVSAEVFRETYLSTVG